MSRASGRPYTPEEAKRIADRYFPETADQEDPEETREFADELGPEEAGPETTLTPKQARFVDEYLIDLNATQAAIRAGYSEATAAAIGYENLRKPHIRRAVIEKMKEREIRTNWTADRVLVRLGEALTADIADLYDQVSGKLKPIADWPLIWRTGLVAGLETRDLYGDTGEGHEKIGVVHKLKLADRTRHLELIGKHVDILAFAEKKVHDLAPGGPLAELYEEIAGISFKPKDVTPPKPQAAAQTKKPAAAPAAPKKAPPPKPVAFQPKGE